MLERGRSTDHPLRTGVGTATIQSMWLPMLYSDSRCLPWCVLIPNSLHVVRSLEPHPLSCCALIQPEKRGAHPGPVGVGS